MDAGDYLHQSFGKEFLNKVQVCPVAGQEPALAKGAGHAGKSFGVVC